MTDQTLDDVDRAMDELKSFHKGDLGIIHVITCGKRAIPALRDLLFERDPSGLFEARCRAIDALRALGARDVLLEFLRAPHDAIDPIERLGNDAVVNAAARAVAKYREEQVFQLLLTLAGRRLLPGVVAALGSFNRQEAIPHLIDALAEDECRPAAELALTRLGQSAHFALMQAGTSFAQSPDSGSTSHLRQRQSVRRLLTSLVQSKVKVTNI